jgi:hypothetical protein
MGDDDLDLRHVGDYRGITTDVAGFCRVRPTPRARRRPRTGRALPRSTGSSIGTIWPNAVGRRRDGRAIRRLTPSLSPPQPFDAELLMPPFSSTNRPKTVVVARRLTARAYFRPA